MVLQVQQNYNEIYPPAKHGDAGFDVKISSIFKKDLFSIWYLANVKVKIPDGHVGLLLPRSSVSNKGTHQLANSVGVIDSGFTGQFQIRFNRTLKGFFTQHQYEPGTKIAQLVIVPFVAPKIELVEELSQTQRGSDGFGTTG